MKKLFFSGVVFFLLLYACKPGEETSLWVDELNLATMDAGWGAPEPKLSIIGRPLVISGVTYERGIGTHADSRFDINLNGNAIRFSAFAGLDDEVDSYDNTGASCRFTVLLDDKPVFQSPVLQASDSAVHIDIDITGGKILSLIVDGGGDGTHWDHADWAMAKITVAAGAKYLPVPLYSISPVSPYILTPPAPVSPRINTPAVYGARPGRPFLYRIPVSGERPLTVEIAQLPRGLKLDPQKGIISGTTPSKGTYALNIKAINAHGADSVTFEIISGDTIALTPPMGFNTWNVYGLEINEQKILNTIRAFDSLGLADYGYSYINIDDGWEAPQRDAQGVLQGNDKFPDIRALADSAHARGLKLGIYSSPGAKTCGGFPGSLGHEEIDARTWAAWGIDYLKYDWCSYSDEAKSDSLPELQKPYLAMRKALDKVNRDIVYSLCQYGMGNVWEWGREAGGNCWRTTGDIVDTWGSLKTIGFGQNGLESYAGPGHWNDPDMLVIGMVGWGRNIHPTRLNADEQYTHITLWSILAAPLLIGCDITQLDEFTFSLLTNREVIAINQDRAAKQGKMVKQDGSLQVWTKPLYDGSLAVAVFNVGYGSAVANVLLTDLGINGKYRCRNVWKNEDEDPVDSQISERIPPHGCVFYRLYPM